MATVKHAGWGEALAVYFTPRMLAIFFLGFSSGLPLALTSSTFQIWQTEVGFDMTAIGLFSLVQISYSLKFLWSPIIDRSMPPGPFKRLGRRRGWALAIQIPLAVAILALGAMNPSEAPGFTAFVAVLVAFFSASQDIVIDGYRIEVLGKEQQGAGSAMVIYGYRLASQLVAGAGALLLAAYLGWFVAYAMMALAMLVGMITVLVVREPEVAKRQSERLKESHGVGLGVAFIAIAASIAVFGYVEISSGVKSVLGDGKWQGAIANFIATFSAAAIPVLALKLMPRPNGSSHRLHRDLFRWLDEAVFEPFADVAKREGWIAIVAFIVLYKLGDAVLGVNASAFYIKIGFDKTQIAEVTKVFGLVASLIGTFLGGLMMLRLGVGRALLIAGILQALSNLMFALQASVGPDIHYFYATIAIENVTGGMGAAVLVGYLSALCNVAFTATQYALFSSLAALGRIVLAAPFSGVADIVGWVDYYFISTVMAAPGLLMLLWMLKRYPAAMGTTGTILIDD